MWVQVGRTTTKEAALVVMDEGRDDGCGKWMSAVGGREVAMDEGQRDEARAERNALKVRLAEVESISDGRRHELERLDHERRAEWTRAEQAEARLADVQAGAAALRAALAVVRPSIGRQPTPTLRPTSARASRKRADR